MGANGSSKNGAPKWLAVHEYYSVARLGRNIIVVQPKDPKKRIKLPEESKTPNMVYVAANNDGTLKSIAVYGDDCLKQIEIHTHSHKGLSPHYHVWKNGAPEKKGNGKHAETTPYPLTPELQLLYNYVQTFFP